MYIRKANKTDFDNYKRFRVECLKDLVKSEKEASSKPTFKQIKKEFNDILTSRRRFLLFAIENNKIIGNLIGTLLENVYEKSGYLDDLFVKKEYRKKRYGKKLIAAFINLIKNKKVKKIRLGVRIINKKAIKFYNNLGFKTTYYEMEKKI
jgi:ribosomal protein S18 acetylase RimI-like enzyme